MSSPSTVTCNSTVTSTVNSRQQNDRLHRTQYSRERNHDGETSLAFPDPLSSYAVIRSDQAVAFRCVVYVCNHHALPLQQNFVLLCLQQLLLHLRIGLQLGELTLHSSLPKRGGLFLPADCSGSGRSGCSGSIREKRRSTVYHGSRCLCQFGFCILLWSDVQFILLQVPFLDSSPYSLGRSASNGLPANLRVPLSSSPTR